MPLPQDITPVNTGLADTIAQTSKMPWLETHPGKASMKILWLGPESGRWAVLFRWKKGYVAAPHKHLAASHTFVLSGKLKVRDGIYNTGDHVYEPNGVLHGATTALEDTEYLFMCDGPILFFDDNGFTSYFGWEELKRMQNAAADNAGVQAAG